MRPPHESLLLELSEESFNLWRHNPITSAYLQYLGDQVEAFRMAAADLLEAGNLDNTDVIRGRLLTLRELQNLSLGDIRNFYRQEESEEKRDGGS
jgi:hypothetical protein